MRTTLFEIFGLKFHSYVTMMSLAFLIGTFGIVHDARRLDPPITGGSTRGGFWGFLGALLGAKIFWILQYDKPVNFWRAVLVWEGGMVFYGGLIGGIVAALIYLRVHKLPVRIVADLAAPYLALGEALGRWGCYLNGCCWGLTTNLPWAVCFPRGSHPFRDQVQQGLITPDAVISLPVHPTQLYSMVGLVLIFFALRALQKKNPFGGAVFLLYLALYGLLRFFVEIYRVGPRTFASMTLSQILSLFLLISAGAVFVCALGYLRRRNAARRDADLDQIASTNS